LATKTDIRVLREVLTRLDTKLDRHFDAIAADLRHIKWMMAVLIGIAIANFAKQFF
jgi:hypothetical protein